MKFLKQRAGRLARILILALPLTSPALAASVGAGAEWTVPGGDPQSTRYSTLSQITTENVKTLKPEFSFSTSQSGTHEGQPLVVGSVMYVVTPFPHRLIALDLTKPGQTLWTFTPTANDAAYGKACCDLVNRGASYADGMIVFNTLDGQTIAVNATTGAQVWATQLGNLSSGMTLTGAPIVAGNVVVVGNAGGEFGVRGWIAGLGLMTGKLKWKAYSTGTDAQVKIGTGFKAFYAKDQGADLGTTSWGGTTLWQLGGGAPWSWITFDPETGLIFYGTGNPGVWNPDLRPGDNKWGATIFARNPNTGEAVWAYQVTPHDGWDFDATSETIAVDLPFEGATRKLLAHFDKNGFAYTMDRTTGQVLVAKPFVHVTWATGINLATGAPTLVAARQPHTGLPTSGICPTPLGGKDYVPASFSPATGLFYLPSNNLCYEIEPLKAVYIKGAPFQGADTNLSPGPGGYGGALIAWNPVTGAPAWSVHETLPVYAGTLATAGGLVFYGTLDGHFKAVSAKTGAVLFNTVLDCGIGSNPISYTAPDGKQRIAVYSGLGWLASGLAGTTCANGGEVHVFKLP